MEENTKNVRVGGIGRFDGQKLWVGELIITF